MYFGLSESQWRYVRHWFILIIGAEILMMIFNQFLFEAYAIVGALFAGGFLLRILKLYPGEWEPLILDFSAVILAICYAILAKILGPSIFRFVLILCSSGIIVPHFIFIYREK